jgi:hypothetical protein
MPGQDATEVTIGANGTIRTAPLGTEIPASINEAPAAGWVDLGLVTEDGATVTAEKSFTGLRAWQSFYDVRRLIESRSFRLSFGMSQFNRRTFGLAVGGGTVSEIGVASGFFRYLPPAPEFIDERMMMLEWVDGDDRFRLTVPRGVHVENTEFNLRRTEGIVLAVAFEALGTPGEDPFVLDTDSVAFSPAA